MYLKKNDQVIVTTGKEKGKTGKILSVLLREERVLVEGLNRVKRHMRPSPKLKQGGILEKEMPIHVSNLLLLCPRCQKGVRVRFRNEGEKEGKKIRICQKCGEAIGS